MLPHEFWQEIEPAGAFDLATAHKLYYPARLAGGRVLRLPIRPLGDGEHALASLILNQASFSVVDALAADLAERLRLASPEVVVGLPTLGLTLASAVALKLGHRRYVPLGTSRKFWYEETLSVALSSITSPSQSKRLYIDPRMLSLLQGKRIALIDDVISSGASMLGALALLELASATPEALGCAMLQSDRWRAALGGAWIENTKACFAAPMLRKNARGLWVETS